ncbi:MAG: hypothetical protein KC457_25860 [Myxococcales bacterium]|nr:hypothetical protein [Myxococcales bacterium]
MSAEEGRSEQQDKGGSTRSQTRPAILDLALVGIWALLVVISLIAGGSSPLIAEAGLEALVPAEHRSQAGRPLALLQVRLDPEAATEDEDEAPADSGERLDPRTILAEAGFAIEEAMGPERVPFAPPKTEITRWLDAHALYLLPVDAHPALAERLSDAFGAKVDWSDQDEPDEWDDERHYYTTVGE